MRTKIAIPWTTRPPSWARIDKDNPLAKGLILAYPLNQSTAAIAQNAVDGRHNLGILQGVPVWTPQGIDFEKDATQRLGVTAGVSIPAIGSGPYCLLMGVIPEANTTSQGLFGFNTYDPAFALSATNNVYVYDGGNKTASSGTVVDGVLSAIAFNRYSTAAGGLGYYINGTAAGTATHADSLVAATSIHLGYDGGVYSFDGVIYYAFFWNRALSAAEIAELSRNPWQVFQPVEIWVDNAATGSSRQLSASISSGTAAADAAKTASRSISSAIPTASSAADITATLAKGMLSAVSATSSSADAAASVSGLVSLTSSVTSTTAATDAPGVAGRSVATVITAITAATDTAGSAGRGLVSIISWTTTATDVTATTANVASLASVVTTTTSCVDAAGAAARALTTAIATVSAAADSTRTCLRTLASALALVSESTDARAIPDGDVAKIYSDTALVSVTTRRGLVSRTVRRDLTQSA